MNVRELYDLAVWVEKEIADRKIVVHYQTLQNKLNQNAQPNNEQRPIAEDRERLVAALREVNLSVLTKQQRDLLDTNWILDYVGEVGVKALEDILVHNVVDVSTAGAEVGKIATTLNNSVNHFKTLRTSMEHFVEDEEAFEVDGALMRVTFTSDASIDNVVDLETWSANWRRIGYGVAVACDQTAEDVRVSGAANGSVIIEFLLGVGLANCFLTVINKALDATLKILQIRDKLSEVKGMDLGKEVEKAVAAALEKSRKDKIDQILEDVIAAKVLPKMDNVKKESLKMSIKELVEFYEKGGEVDFVLPEDATETAQANEGGIDYHTLTNSIAALREKQETILALEAKVGPEDPVTSAT